MNIENNNLQQFLMFSVAGVENNHWLGGNLLDFNEIERRTQEIINLIWAKNQADEYQDNDGDGQRRPRL